VVSSCRRSHRHGVTHATAAAQQGRIRHRRCEAFSLLALLHFHMYDLVILPVIISKVFRKECSNRTRIMRICPGHHKYARQEVRARGWKGGSSRSTCRARMVETVVCKLVGSRADGIGNTSSALEYSLLNCAAATMTHSHDHQNTLGASCGRGCNITAAARSLANPSRSPAAARPNGPKVQGPQVGGTERRMN
jgi:hypothetical protein